MEKYCRARQVTDDNMAHALCMLDNQGYKHSERVILTAFPLQQWLRERVAVRCYTYAACLVATSFSFRVLSNLESSIHEQERLT